MNRYTVPIFSALLAIAAAIPASADGPLNAVYQRQTIRFANVSTTAGAPAIGIHDPGLRALLRAAGASLTWQPGDRDVLITTSVPAVVSFAVGDRLYNVGPLALQASIPPYRQGNEVYLPFNELLRSL